MLKRSPGTLQSAASAKPNTFFQPKPEVAKEEKEPSDAGKEKPQQGFNAGTAEPFFSPRVQLKATAPSATADPAADTQTEETTTDKEGLTEPPVGTETAGTPGSGNTDSEAQDKEGPEGPPKTEQDQKGEINAEMQQETAGATATLPVKAEMNEGEPTLLLPEKEPDPADGKVELKQEEQALPEVAGQAPAAEKAPEAAGVPQPVAKEPEAPEPAEEGEKEENVESASLAEGIPAAEPDPAVAEIMALNTEMPSESEKQQDEEDKRSPEEKVREQQSYLTQFNQQAAVTRANIQAGVEEQSMAITLKEQQTAETIRLRTAGFIEQLRSGIAAQKEQLRLSYSTARADLEAKRTADGLRAEQLKAAKVLELQTALTARKTTFDQFVLEQKQAPHKKAEAEATRADGELDRAAAECYQKGNQVASHYPGDDDGHPEAREASINLARDSAQDILAKKPVIREDLMARAADFDGGFDQYQQDTIQQIDNMEAELVPAIENAVNQFVETINETYDQAGARLDAKEEQELQQLDQQEAAGVDRLQQQQEQTLSSVQGTADAVRQLLQANGQQALQTIEQLEQSVSAILAPNGETPFLPGVRQTYEECMASLSQIESEALTGLQGSGTEGNTQLDGIAATFDTNAQQALTDVQQQAAALLASSSASLAETQQTIAQGIEQSFTGITTSLDEMRTEALAGVDQSIEERKGKILQANSEFATELVTQVNESIETAKQPLLDPLSDRIWSAADRATASWWEGILAAVIDLLVMFIVLVVIAAILVAAGVFSTILGALLVIGLLVLAGVFLYSLYKRLDQGLGWSSVLYALSDAVGFTMIYEGYYNESIVTGENLGLSEFDRWYQGTTGTIQLVMIVSPLKSRIPGIRRLSLPRIPGSGAMRSGWNRFAGLVEGIGAGRIRNRPAWQQNPGGYRPPGDRLLNWMRLGRFTRPIAPLPETPPIVPPIQNPPPEPVRQPNPVNEPVKDPVNDPVEPVNEPVQPPKYDPTKRTAAELRQDMDPTPRAGETPLEAAERSRLATEELPIREMMDVFEGLGEKPQPFDIVANDAANADAHTVGNGTNGRHGPAIPLERSLDANGLPDGTRTIEGRIYGDPPWGGRASFSGRWRSIEIINRVINKYLKANWDSIRADLATEGNHTNVFPAGEVAGDGYFNQNFGQPLPPSAKGPVPTNLVRISIEIIPGNPPRYYIVTTFPTISGM